MAGNKFELFEKKMRGEGLSEAAIDAFRHNYEQLVQGVTGMVRAPTAFKTGSFLLQTELLHGLKVATFELS